jgi:hypothetical protein
VGRIYDEIKARPLYLVADVVRSEPHAERAAPIREVVTR